MHHPVYPLAKMAEKIEFVSFDTIRIKDKEMKSHWFKYENIDLYYYETQSGGLAKFHISMFGQVLEWAPVAGLRTGLLIEEERSGQVFEIIQYDERSNPGTLAQTLLVLRNANSVASNVCEEMISHIEDVQNGRGGNTSSSRWRRFVQKLLSLFRS